MAAASTIAIVGLVIAAAGVAVQHQQGQRQAAIGRSQAHQQRRAAELEKQRADIQNARALRSALRQSRIARGTAENQAAQAGTSGSSGLFGSLASLGTQEGVNRGVFTQQKDISEEQMGISGEMANLHAAHGASVGRAATGAALGSVGSTLFGIYGGALA